MTHQPSLIDAITLDTSQGVVAPDVGGKNKNKNKRVVLKTNFFSVDDWILNPIVRIYHASSDLVRQEIIDRFTYRRHA